MELLIVFLPLLSFAFAGPFARFFTRRIICLFSIIIIFIDCLLSIYVFFNLKFQIINIKLFNWIYFDSINITFGILIDSLTISMLIIVTGISFFVHFYSIGYMEHEPYLPKFLAYLSLFTFFMLILITSDNFLQMFIGWEGVGLCSYLLINFWYNRVLANKAALKAMIMNRIADVFFILAVLIIVIEFKTTDYLIVFALIEEIVDYKYSFFALDFYMINVISFFLFIGAIGKSAQLGFHTWLPDAMEGPTPVSSLLHAATMVTAGVFLIIRCSPIFEYSALVLNLIVIIGGFTAFFSAIIGVFQYDVKKIIAYSTCSQLGYMFFSCGLSGYQVAIFHLVNHAFFKALLFLSAGSIIHSLNDEQDMRRMGGLLNFLPFTYLMIFIGSFSIMGFPFLTGFYSKDLLLELAFVRFVVNGNFIYFLGIASAMFTAIYSIRMIIFVFFFKSNSFRVFFTSNESTIFMSFSMFFLSIFSIFIGYFFSDIMVGLGSYFWGNSIFLNFDHYTSLDFEFLHPLVKNLPVIVSLFGCFLSVGFLNYYLSANPVNSFSSVFFIGIWNTVSSFFFNSGFFNFIYNFFFLELFKFSYFINNKYLDKGYFEYFGPFGLYRFFRLLARFFYSNPPSLIFFYIFVMFSSLFVFFFLLFISSKCFFVILINNGLLLILFVIIFDYIRSN